MLRITAWWLGGLVALAALVFVAQIVASETGEVVVLTTRDAAGEPVQTRLWVVDHDGSQFLRASEGSGWYGRLLSEPEVKLRRADVVKPYRATPGPAQRDAVNELMRTKYGWRDVLISALLADRDDAIPVRLVPALSTRARESVPG